MRRVVAAVLVAAAVAVWATILTVPLWWQLTETSPDPCPPASSTGHYEYGWEPC